MALICSLVLALWPSSAIQVSAQNGEAGTGGSASSGSTTESNDNLAAAAEDLIEVEAEPTDITIELNGPRHAIAYVDQDLSGKSDYVALISHLYGNSYTVPKYYVAVVMDHQNKVVQVVNPSVNGLPPAWEPAPVDVVIPEGGFLLLAHDDSYASKGFKKYLAENFQLGDVIKLRKNGDVVPLAEIISSGPRPSVKVDQQSMFTVNEQNFTLSGGVTHMQPGDTLTVYGVPVTLGESGLFEAALTLQEGVNYVDTVLTRDGEELARTSTVVYYKPGPIVTDEEVLMWVEQGPNAKKFQSSEDVYNMLVKAADAGITGILLDVKGYEGFVSYKKNDLTGRPYVSEMTDPNRVGVNPELDLLEEFVKHSRALGLTIHAAVNVFAEGSMHENAVLDAYPEWEEKVYRPEDGGQIVPIRQSAAANKIVAFVNPANEDVRDYQLATFEEIIKNYDVDGINLDRGRYDNYFADFSEETRGQFEAYLEERGKELEAWPDDVYKLVYDSEGRATRVEGQYYLDWWAFRSGVIKSFTDEVRQLADEYSEEKGKPIQVSAYVGSWYDSLYMNGINWASPDFRYDQRLGFTEDRIYTDDYYNTGYIGNLDFLMIGTYQSTESEIEHYMTLGNILTRGEVPLYASIALSNVREPELQRTVFQAAKQKTDGMMLFDYSLVNFDTVKAALNDEEYVKSYQLGISMPGQPDGFLEGDFLNMNRNEGNINVFSNEFGLSTDTSKWGVEIAVAGTGEVVHTANKEQAMNWNWANVDPNDSDIPDGGFVISAADPSGMREKRQLVAGLYAMGDEVRASLLEGFRAYDGITVDHHQLQLQGTVTVLGFGEYVEVKINGKKAKLNGNRANPRAGQTDPSEPIHFADKVKLDQGENAIVIEIYVDGMKTNEKTILVTCN
ncbi:family 10 glycosylhydrolase [Paenibacillus chungangensis]|uniref:Family 10 glycosylhydrolase n=1 Tax=Paenibacillus chungangensis TaxID=696535 RepID=A0ABW3HSS4_9BACL